MPREAGIRRLAARHRMEVQNRLHTALLQPTHDSRQVWLGPGHESVGFVVDAVEEPEAERDTHMRDAEALQHVQVLGLHECVPMPVHEALGALIAGAAILGDQGILVANTLGLHFRRPHPRLQDQPSAQVGANEGALGDATAGQEEGLVRRILVAVSELHRELLATAGRRCIRVALHRNAQPLVGRSANLLRSEEYAPIAIRREIEHLVRGALRLCSEFQRAAAADARHDVVAQLQGARAARRRHPEPLLRRRRIARAHREHWGLAFESRGAAEAEVRTRCPPHYSFFLARPWRRCCACSRRIGATDGRIPICLGACCEEC
mmetsp:Transcript_116599/g.334687  ORF Transcript_116599/g.334687 Transcript_116599/m.334687 type:complete len:321 (-) Transcript_116599:46-1008(-)